MVTQRASATHLTHKLLEDIVLNFLLEELKALTVDALMCNYPLYCCSYTAYGALSISIIYIMTGYFVENKLNEGNQDFQRHRMGRTLTKC